jgi:MoaA/NifB/PqqE/SkfB family radical SAM enzyme
MSELGWKYLTESDKESILRGVLDGEAHGGPYHVEIHPADRCNVDCFFCSTATLRGTDEVPLRRFEELLAELKDAGTRSIRLSGGGEPLFHREIRKVLAAISASGIPIENLTTNGVLLRDELAELLIDARLDQVTVSLNAGEAKSYGAMMQTAGKNFDRVLANIRNLVAAKQRRRLPGPSINLQFLIWRENFHQIPSMYRLGRELGVDTILFNGLAFLRPDQKMTPEETAAMMRLYEEIVRIDEYRTIGAINSYEQDLSAGVDAINGRVTAERLRRPRPLRMFDLLLRSDFTLRQKLEHHRRMAGLRRAAETLGGVEQFCLIAWHSLVIRTGGIVAPCCILQASEMGNVYRQKLADVWHGESYRQLRRELTEIIAAGEDWEHDPARHRTVVPMCGGKGAEVCPIRSIYYRTDVPFLEPYGGTVDAVRSQPRFPAGDAQ